MITLENILLISVMKIISNNKFYVKRIKLAKK